MLRRVRWLLEEREPDAKIILLGHNEHLALEQKSLWIRRVGESKVSPKYVLGDQLSRRFPNLVFAVWMDRVDRRYRVDQGGR